MFTLESLAISWKSFKQTFIVKSTIKSEFITLDKCDVWAKWLCSFLEDILSSQSMCQQFVYIMIINLQLEG